VNDNSGSMRKETVLLTIKNLLKNPRFLLLLVALVLVLATHPVVAAEDDPPEIPGVPNPDPDPSPT